jgi:hypothetical protein
MNVVHPEVDADRVADAAPSAPEVTDYDRRHLITYLRLLDAVTEGADRVTIVRDVLKLAPGTPHERADRAYSSHLARARWMTQHGYQQLLKDAPAPRKA